MRLIPILLDVGAIGLMAFAFLCQTTPRWLRPLSAVVALLGAFAAALIIAATTAPQWEGILTTVTLVIGFYAFAAVVHPMPRPGPSDGGVSDPELPEATPGPSPTDSDDSAEPPRWLSTERDFADRWPSRPVSASVSFDTHLAATPPGRSRRE